MVTLATRLPKTLHHQLRVFSVTHRVTQMQFIEDALLEKLSREARRGRRVA